MKDSDEAAAFASALRMLARRDHSERELFRKLCGKGFSPQVVSPVLEKLTKLQYLDDRRFASRWVEDALGRHRFFGGRLRMELVRRGIDAELADEVVAAATEGASEAERLAEVVARKFPGFDAAVATVAEQRRIYQYLLRKGFSSSVVVGLLRGTEF